MDNENVRSTESRDNYLKTILLLQQQQGEVRSIDIAAALGYSRPSVCCAIKKLKQDALVQMTENGLIILTEKGLTIAEKLLERNRVLTQFLQKLGADKNTALENACRIEHVITDEMIEIIKNVKIE